MLTSVIPTLQDAHHLRCDLQLTSSALLHRIFIGASVSELHTGELAGRFSICIYICMYVRYVRDSVYLYDLFKRHPAPGLGTRYARPSSISLGHQNLQAGYLW